MKHLLIAVLAALALTACGNSSTEKPASGAYQLTKEEHTGVNGAADKFFKSKLLEANGKVYTGESLGCAGSDSDRDLNVTCTGNEPSTQGGTVFMREREILCNYGGGAFGCKAKK